MSGEKKKFQADKRDVWSWWIGFLNRNLAWVWIFFIAITAVGVHYTMKLRLNTDLQRLLPKSYKSVQVLNDLTTRMGGNGDFQFLIESSNWDKTLKFGKEFASRLRAMPDMRYVDFERPYQFFEKNQLLYLTLDDLEDLHSKIKKKVHKAKVNALVSDLANDDEEEVRAPTSTHDKTKSELAELEEKYVEYRPKPYFQDVNNKYLLIKTMPTASQVNIKEAKRIYSVVEKMWKDLREEGGYGSDLQVTFGGQFKNRILEYDTVYDDVVSSAWIIVSLTLFLIWVCFRSITWTVLCSAPLIISMMWTFAIVYLTLDALNLITAFMFMIMLGLGIDYGIALLSRYINDRTDGASSEAALIAMLRHTGRASRAAATTMSLSFFSLLITDFKGFSEFGLIMGVGIPFALIAYFTLLPAMLVTIDRYLPRLNSFKKVGSSAPQPLVLNNYRPFPAAKAIVFGGAALAALGLWALFQVQFEYNFSKLRAQSPEREAQGPKFEAVHGKRSNSPAIYLTETPEQSMAVKAALQNHMETHPGHTIDVVRSVLDVVPSDQEEKIAVIKKIDGLLTENVIAKTEDRADRDRLQRFKQSLAVRTPITMKDVPEDMIRGFRDADRKLTYFTFVYPKVELVDARNAMAFQVDVAAVKTPLGIYYASSQSMIFADMMRVMIRDGQLAFLVTSLFVFFSLWHDFKSLKITLIIMTPLMFSMLAHILVMKLMGIKFNLYNIIAFPALIGEGMEYSIQYCNRYLEDPKKGPTYAFRTMFRPLLFCSLTSCVGYGGLVLATHPGLRSLGISSTVGVLLALLFALAMTPAIWQLFPHKNNPRRPTHLPKDAEPTSDIQPIFEPSRGTTADSISAAAADERRFRS